MVTSSTQNNSKLLEKLRSGFKKKKKKKKIDWNRYQPKVSTEKQNEYLNFLIEPNS